MEAPSLRNEGKMNILLATDGKAHSEKAVEYAFEHVKSHKAHLYIVYVVSPKADEDKERLTQGAMGVLEGLKNRAVAQGIQVTTLLEAGSPYQTILAAADRIKADAIIVGTSGKTALDRVLIGSVSEYIVRNARCTVIIVK
jgi:nucleotide-binding universal stress UspA family protein